MTIATVLGAKGADVIHIAPTTPLRALVALLAERHIGAVPVIEGGRVVGILSERDIVRLLHQQGPDILDWPAERAMTPDPITVGAETPLLAALSLMTQRRVRHLPVVENGALVGFVSIGDLVKARIERIESEAEAMRAYIAT